MSFKEELERQLEFEETLRFMQLKYSSFTKDTAHYFGVRPSAIRMWEDGIIKPHPEFRYRIMDWIITYED